MTQLTAIAYSRVFFKKSYKRPQIETVESTPNYIQSLTYFSERLVNDTRFELWIIYERKWRRGHRMERDFETLFFVSSREKRAQKSLRRTVFYIWPFWKRHELSLCLTNALKCNRDNEKCNRIIYAALLRIVRKLHRWRSKSRLKWIMPRC